MKKQTQDTTFIIAEAGVNHNGKLSLAFELVDIAVRAKCDAVKFQTFKAEKVNSIYLPKAEYQLKNTDKEESFLEMAKSLELNFEEHEQLISYCQDREIMFLSAPHDIDSIDVLANLGLEIFKIPSGDITNLPYLRKVGSLDKEVILSTGMSNLDEIEAALSVLTISGTKVENITLLHCNTEYPTPLEDVNLKAMITIKNKFRTKIGYSDHTSGIDISIAAVALGASVIEKHITIDKSLEGPDHKASIEPYELGVMVKRIREIELALGDGEKRVSKSEAKNINIARKSIVASKPIKKGDVLTVNNITIKRPGNGVSPMLWDTVLGSVSVKDYSSDQLIEIHQ
jgi:N,N'-diacetyllegionaminate synthase